MSQIGGVLAHVVEGWAPLASAYFSLISILTVGYGDFSPATRLGRLLTALRGQRAALRLGERVGALRSLRLRARRPPRTGSRPHPTCLVMEDNSKPMGVHQQHGEPTVAVSQ